MNNLTFEWDEAKRRSNRKKHGLDFVDAAELFKDASLQVFADIRHESGEERWVGLGMLGGLVAVVVFLNPLPRVIRIVSLRKADKDEEAEYFKNAFID